MKTRTEIDKKEAEEAENLWWKSGNAGKGRPKRALCFTDKLRYQLSKKKKFRRPDGTEFESTELDLLTMKIVQELRTTVPINIPLLNTVLNRIEGKPQETISIDETLEVSRGIDAREVILQRLSKIITVGEGEESHQ